MVGMSSSSTPVADNLGRSLVTELCSFMASTHARRPRFSRPAAMAPDVVARSRRVV
ncbi:uncharacterized protein BDZ83DRAFT_625045 [Colletotrichum acutatum]|uniref:Uncharacterized protein n=1 Tax=Glomerella acutata TaxID=27357 RepID=A0AAD8XE58_GLOAC|nr:uncharacterized protein BDZ83DRAFT_625045 [Colletotrichum acutatum]KAK1723897.1 hypothetical protein BDZ83DRAFT_625045 [Colletotrichum acutatum]